jgi:hypothetical protein
VQSHGCHDCLTSFVTVVLLVCVSVEYWQWDKMTYYLSDIQLKTNETGTWMNSPTAARALLVSPGKPKDLMMVGP